MKNELSQKVVTIISELPEMYEIQFNSLKEIYADYETVTDWHLHLQMLSDFPTKLDLFMIEMNFTKEERQCVLNSVFSDNFKLQLIEEDSEQNELNINLH